MKFPALCGLRLCNFTDDLNQTLQNHKSNYVWVFGQSCSVYEVVSKMTWAPTGTFDSPQNSSYIWSLGQIWLLSGCRIVLHHICLNNICHPERLQVQTHTHTLPENKINKHIYELGLWIRAHQLWCGRMLPGVVFALWEHFKKMSAGVRRLSIRLFRFLQITQSSRNLMLRAVQIKPSGAAAVRVRSSKSLICMSFARQSSCVTLPADTSYIHSVNSSGPLTCFLVSELLPAPLCLWAIIKADPPNFLPLSAACSHLCSAPRCVLSSRLQHRFLHLPLTQPSYSPDNLLVQFLSSPSFITSATQQSSHGIQSAHSQANFRPRLKGRSRLSTMRPRKAVVILKGSEMFVRTEAWTHKGLAWESAPLAQDGVCTNLMTQEPHSSILQLLQLLLFP